MTDRFWSKVNTDGPIGTHRPDLGPCWLWTGYITSDGYGKFQQTRPYCSVGAHRMAYELATGSIPKGFQIDHLCRTRACVNPRHLEAKTLQDNIHAPGSEATAAINAAKSHCPQGHEYSAENTRMYQNRRYCRACLNLSNARRKTR